MTYADFELAPRLAPEPLAGAEQARDRRGREVRIRCLRRADDSGRERFRRLARAWSSLTHPGVTRVLEIGEVEGDPYLVERLEEGRSLAAVVADKAVDPQARIVLLLRLAACLEGAHERDVAHQSLTIAEVTVAADGSPWLAGFGIGRLLTAEAVRSGRDTPPAELLAGCPPEEILGGEAGLGGDVYAFGVLAYQVLSGDPPFPIASPETLLVAKMADRSVSFGDRYPEYPKELRRLVESCMARDPAARPSGFAAIRQRLESLPPVVDEAGGRSEAEAPTTSGERPAREAGESRGRSARRRSTRWLLAGALIIACVVFMLSKPRFSTDPQPGATPVGSVVPEAVEVESTSGLLAVDARPWGEVVQITDAAGGELQLPALRYTPLTVAVLPGVYQVSIRRPDRVEQVTCSAQVVAGGRAECLVEFFAVSPRQYFRESGWWR